MQKYSLEGDPRGLMYEAYRMEGITSQDCRSIFFDWALGLKFELDPIKELTIIYNVYAEKNPGHPMNKVLKEGLSKFNSKTTRRRRRQNRD
mgnify:CR=1 FL=1